MYDYEFFPQKVWPISAKGALILSLLGHRQWTRPQIHRRRLYVRTRKISQSFKFLFKFIIQLLPGMRRGNREYLLCLRICVLGRSETVVLQHAEGSACSWTSSAPWLWHQNAEHWRRVRRWYWEVPRKNASTAWKTISIFCMILFPFFPFFVFELHT